jgi:hypothetical protein
MSEGLAYGGSAPAPGEPVYGDGRLGFEAPAKSKETLERPTEIALAVAIFVPALAAYGVVAYAVYRAASALI